MGFSIFWDPDGFLARRAESPGFRDPVIVVLLAGVAGVIAGLPAADFATQIMPAEAQVFGGFVYVTTIVGGFVGPFVRWGLYAVVFYAVATVAYDPDGSFKTVLSLTAWGFIPAIPAALVNGAFSYLVFSDVSPPTDPAQAAQFAQRLQSSPTLVIASLVGLAFLAWSALIWTFAVRHSLSLTLRDAAMVVAVPVAFAVLFRLYSVIAGGFL